MDLFDHNRQKTINKTAPLAARMRPRTLDEFVGQSHIIGRGRLLRRAIQADQLSSLIFYGPPGTGKTTLARIIANTTHAHFIALNAVLSGVKDIREAIAVAQEKMGMFGQRTILFVDEVHRFNKAQQDALLPHVENGTVILIGATTENPYFEVNKALVSRSRIFELKPLADDDLRAIIRQALADEERGYGKLNVSITDEALAHLINVANGDARGVLNALELAVETTPPGNDGIIRITTEIAEESIQKRAVLYDKDGDAHFDVISAFIKSLRGSDPDAALYWLAKMVYAGEDPRFIFRRMLILASEDIGMADPNALQVVVSAAQAFEYVGLPEGRFHLTQACLYLATAPKSNSTMGFFDALAAVENEREADVPNHLKDSNRDGDDFGHGAGYLYPHAYRDHWVAQQYLPDSLQGRGFYQPSEQGYEAKIHTQVARRREAQLAAMLSTGEDVPWGGVDAAPKAHNRWLQRTLSTVGEQLAAQREKLFALAQVQRHELVLDLNAGTGLLAWEAVRRSPVGGVWALAADERTAEALRRQAENLDALNRPQILVGTAATLAETLAVETDIRFEVMVGRNVLTRDAAKTETLARLRQFLADGGRLVLWENIPRHTQRLHALLDTSGVDAAFWQRVIAAEEAIYSAADDPMVNWDAADLAEMAAQAGFTVGQLIEVPQVAEFWVSDRQISRWFDDAPAGSRLSYAQRLQQTLSAEEIAQLRKMFDRQVLNRQVMWHSQGVFLLANV